MEVVKKKGKMVAIINIVTADTLRVFFLLFADLTVQNNTVLDCLLEQYISKKSWLHQPSNWSCYNQRKNNNVNLFVKDGSLFSNF